MLNLPQTPQQAIDRLTVDFLVGAPQFNPQLKNSLIGAFLLAYGLGEYRLAQQIAFAILQCFPDTATGIYLERWGSIYGIYRLPAVQSSGNVTFTGTVGTTIPSGTTINIVNTNQQLLTTLDVDITSKTFTSANATILASGGVATMTFTDVVDEQFWKTLYYGMPFAISGATEAQYNNSFTIRDLISPNIVAFNISPGAANMPTGAWEVEFLSAQIPVQSVGVGVNQNAPAYTLVNLASPIAGINNQAGVGAVPIGGGTDLEKDDSLQDRLLFRLRQPIGDFSEAAIELTILSVPGNTRAWTIGANDLVRTVTPVSVTLADTVVPGFKQMHVVLPPSTSPKLETGQIIQFKDAIPANLNGQYVINSVYNGVGGDELLIIIKTTDTTVLTLPSIDVPTTYPGQVRAYYVRDNDGSGLDILPDAGEVANTKAEVEKIKPANAPASSIFVEAPVPVIVDVEIANLLPNTVDMKNIITANLQELFTGRDLAKGINLFEIQDTIARATDIGGNQPRDFDLISPVANVSAEYNELIILGNVTFT